MHKETIVLIVGAGPAGIATSACLNLKNIPNIVLEREDCCASLWKKRTYDRLNLHLAKQFCNLPHMPFPQNAPTFIPKNGFIQYLDNYVSSFRVKPLFHRTVESALFDDVSGKWLILARNLVSGEVEEFAAVFLVVATGENSEGFIPNVVGLEGFMGDVMHSSQYENGKKFCDKNVLVVGCGNSGMEIAYDLSNWEAKTSIVIKSPVHVLTKRIVHLGMTLLKIFPLGFVDAIIIALSRVVYGNLSQFGITRPIRGPFRQKIEMGRSPVIDVGTIDRIKDGAIRVLPAVKGVVGDMVHFANGETRKFDAIVFATGYKSTVRKWLKDDGGLFDEEGMPKKTLQMHWKGEKGLYCVGFARAGLFGIHNEAISIAQDISQVFGAMRKEF